MITKPSQYQKDIFKFIGTGKGHGIVDAVAGSGKTSTLLHALFMIKGGEVIYLAFNKTIADELKSKVPNNVQARTFHSLCYKTVMEALGIRTVETNKLWNIQKQAFSSEDGLLYGTFTRKLVSMARQVGMEIF